MKIEKINDSQIKFTLSQSDLTDREIKISELAYGSQKAQDLFRDMMEEAFEEYGFDADNAPLMIEAVPLSAESIMVIVTKVDHPEDLDEKLGALHPKKNIRKFKKKSSEKHNKKVRETLYVYSFEKLDDVIDLSARLFDLYEGTSSLYKDEQNHKYFLVLYKNDFEEMDSSDFESLLSEYGDKHVSSTLSEGFLLEHGELLIQSKAVDVLARHFTA